MLDDPAERRPVLLPGDVFSAFSQAYDPPGTRRASAPVSQEIVVALPAPYDGCGI
jgi:hypothetical protein